MKVVIAIDSFKGSLTSMQAGNAIKEGILLADSTAKVVVKPLADGGEGTVEALVTGLHGRSESIEVTGPLGEKVVCPYGVLDQTKTAIIEMSGAAGIMLVPNGRKNPMNTTTYGVGEVIRHGMEIGCRNFIIGIGGSATNDGGVGMLQALGYEFLNEQGQEVPLGAKGLHQIVQIKRDKVNPELKNCHFQIACDVNNPLCGENGASYIFGPQKGADEKMVQELDAALSHYADVTEKELQHSLRDTPGTGAAGGMGFAFLSFLDGELRPGIQIILQAIGLEDELKDADYVVTGEGKLDKQTVMGKAPSGVAKLAKKYDKKVIALAGGIGEDASECNNQGIDSYFCILNQCISLKDAMKEEKAIHNVRDTAEQVFRLIKCVKR